MGIRRLSGKRSHVGVTSTTINRFGSGGQAGHSFGGRYDVGTPEHLEYARKAAVGIGHVLTRRCSKCLQFKVLSGFKKRGGRWVCPPCQIV